MVGVVVLVVVGVLLLVVGVVMVLVVGALQLWRTLARTDFALFGLT